MMDVALFDDTNPITDWLNGSMAESQPILDEEDGRPSRELRREVWEAILAGKRKRDKGVKNKRRRKQANEDVDDEYVGSDSDTTTPCDVETVDSSSTGNGVSEDDESGDGGSEDGEGDDEHGQGEATNQTGEDNNNRPYRNYGDAIFLQKKKIVARSRTAPEICGVEIFWHGNQVVTLDIF
ncbi:hypothetical protein EJB05_28756 [Eragrostis curvula]|uniref:Uncharacterized protein n=1 Tax=Eragrostis curvula TaxID=38414 RepID=A0A5J9UQT4_9POAL|nr:hypothetical protein EJB05_28756 [Eragrostis curvula]